MLETELPQSCVMRVVLRVFQLPSTNRNGPVQNVDPEISQKHLSRWFSFFSKYSRVFHLFDETWKKNLVTDDFIASVFSEVLHFLKQFSHNFCAPKPK